MTTPTPEEQARELLPCPFCGGIRLTVNFDGDGSFWTDCASCAASGPRTSKYSGEEGDPFIDWNTRTLSAESDPLKTLPTPDEMDGSDPGKFISTIADGLRHAIRDHGPITPERIGSAAKRVWARIKDTKYDPFRLSAEYQRGLDAGREEAAGIAESHDDGYNAGTLIVEEIRARIGK